MLKNALNIAIRNLKANPLFTFLNMASMVIGLLVIYIAFSYLRFEKSYDTFHEDSELLYRVGRTLRQQDYAVVGFSNWNNSNALEQKAQINGIKAVAGIDNAAQFYIANEPEYLTYGEVRLTQEKILSTNTPAGFTELFSWKLLAGNFNTFKDVQNTMLINASTAYKLLGNTNYDALIDKPVTLGEETFSVAAVIEDVPANSHFDFKVATHVPRIDYWGSHMYVKLLTQAQPDAVENRLNEAVLKIDPSLATNETYKRHFLQKVTDIHLKSNILYELKPPGNANYMYLIGVFGLLIILIALFNYANFTLALKTRQSRVIGVRKVLGASRVQIASQFLIEALVLVLLSLPILFVAIYITVPFFNEFMDVSLARNPLRDVQMIPVFLLITLTIGILASIAPALLISSKKTLTLFKEKLGAKSAGRFSMRRYLIISQFSILIGVSSVSYFMYRQIQFIEQKDLGFKKDGILFTYSNPDDLEAFQAQLKSIPEVETVGNGSAFGIETFNNVRYRLEGSTTIFEDANQFYLDYDAVKAYDLKTTLSPDIFQNSSNRIRRDLINKSAAERFAKLKGVAVNELIGTRVIMEPEYQNEDGNYGIPITIAGIYEDIHVFSLRERVAPYFITVSDNVRMGGLSIVAFNEEATEATLSKIKAVYDGMSNLYPLEIEFLDANFQELHARDKRTAKLVFILNGIAILLAGMGIVSITLLLIVGKTKEIGIRKVLGASELQILKLSVREYVGFVFLGLILSAPLSWLVAQNWLDNFAYRVALDIWVFPLVAILVFVLAALIVGTVSLKSAMTNPIKSLRTE